MLLSDVYSAESVKKKLQDMDTDYSWKASKDIWIRFIL